MQLQAVKALQLAVCLRWQQLSSLVVLMAKSLLLGSTCSQAQPEPKTPAAASPNLQESYSHMTRSQQQPCTRLALCNGNAAAGNAQHKMALPLPAWSQDFKGHGNNRQRLVLTSVHGTVIPEVCLAQRQHGVQDNPGDILLGEGSLPCKDSMACRAKQALPDQGLTSF